MILFQSRNHDDCSVWSTPSLHAATFFHSSSSVSKLLRSLLKVPLTLLTYTQSKGDASSVEMEMLTP